MDGTRAEKLRANALVNKRVRRGRLARPTACTHCGKEGRVDAHHEDYAKPADIEWLCRSCHMKRHHRRNTEERTALPEPHKLESAGSTPALGTY